MKLLKIQRVLQINQGSISLYYSTSSFIFYNWLCSCLTWLFQGIHLDPSIYLMEEENKDSHTKDRESGTLVEDSAKPVENILDNATEQSQSASASDAENTMTYSVTEGTVDERDASQTEVTNCSRATSVAEIASGPQGFLISLH